MNGNVVLRIMEAKENKAMNYEKNQQNSQCKTQAASRHHFSHALLASEVFSLQDFNVLVNLGSHKSGSLGT